MRRAEICGILQAVTVLSGAAVTERIHDILRPTGMILGLRECSCRTADMIMRSSLTIKDIRRLKTE